MTTERHNLMTLEEAKQMSQRLLRITWTGGPNFNAGGVIQGIVQLPERILPRYRGERKALGTIKGREK